MLYNHNAGGGDDDDDDVLKMGSIVGCLSGLSECLVLVVKTSG